MTKKTFFCTVLLMVAAFGFVPNIKAQVTIGSNAEPKATLDVKAEASDATLAGVIAPRMERDYLNTHTYGSDQTGAIVYVTVINGTVSSQTAGITTPDSYYYFDGSVWKAFGAPAKQFVVSPPITDNHTVTNEDFLDLNCSSMGKGITLPVDASVPVGRIVYMSNRNMDMQVYPNLRNPGYSQCLGSMVMVVIYLGGGVWDALSAY